jgi:hypothetical protein
MTKPYKKPEIPFLPIGSQSFEGMIRGGYVYVDKTSYFYRMIRPGMEMGATGGKFFFSRPRRFGKSLTISTLESIFSGKKELFKGLYIAEQTDYDFKEYPVLWFDFSNIGHGTADELNRVLIDHVGRYAAQYGMPESKNLTAREAFEKLIYFFKKQNQKVVILIDEYDKPILDHITNLEIAKQNRDVLKGFYEIIKANDESIRFVFITGITKFSQMNIFSGMNNLRDISLDAPYAAMCGYTQEELEASFQPHLSQFAEAKGTTIPELLTKIKTWYNGFRFTKAPVTLYNPFSTLLLLDSQEFQYHWFTTGTPTYLMDLIREHGLDVTEVGVAKISSNETASYNIDNLSVNVSALLFQTGYLTILGVESEGDLLILGYPNLEVKEAFNHSLIQSLAGSGQSPEVTVIHLRNALIQDDVIEVMRIIKLFFSKIPYDIQESTEKYYQSLFYLIFTVIGTRIRAEVRTNKGRIDAVVETQSHLYLFEFKLDGTTTEALWQIDSKEYAFSYQDSGKEIRKIGVAFSIAERNIVDWEMAYIKDGQ